MTALDRLSGETTVETVTRGLLVVLFGLLAYGAVAGEASLLVNGVIALPIVFAPRLLQWRTGHPVDPRLSLWITAAVVVHVAGFLGAYDVQTGVLSLYDSFAHALSASFVAGVGYAVLVAFERSTTRIRFPPTFRFVFTLSFILALGVAWEIVEFAASGATDILGAGTSPLVQYGVDDIVFDISFNTIGAAIVALWWTGYFSDVADIARRRVFGSRES